MFIERAAKYNWKELPQLIDAVFKILSYKTGDSNEYLIELGILEILDVAMRLQLDRCDILYEFINKFMENNTLTLLQIVWENNLNNLALGRAIKMERADLNFIKSTMSFFGPNSIDFI